MPRLFISYSRKDETFARQLAAALESRGADVWVDIDDIPAGMKWSTAIQNGLDAADLMIIIISPDSMASINVEDEWQYYLDQHKPIIPVLLKHSKVHFQLSRIQYIDFNKQDFDTAFDQLRSELYRKGIPLDPPLVAEASIQSVVEAPTTDAESEPEPEPEQSLSVVDTESLPKAAPELAPETQAAPEPEQSFPPAGEPLVPIPPQTPLPVDNSPPRPQPGQDRSLDYWASRIDDGKPLPPESPQNRFVRPAAVIGLVLVVLIFSTALIRGHPPAPTPTRGLPTQPSTLVNLAAVKGTDTTSIGTSTAPIGPATGLIAFATVRGFRSDIFFINADGSNLRQITHTGTSSCPVWSPDGKRIAYENSSGATNLYVINSDGSNIIQLTKNGLVGGNLSWSPDSKQLVFLEGTDIYVVNVDGSNLRRLTGSTSSGNPNNFEPVWSPDGKTIFFLSSQSAGNGPPFWKNYINSVDPNLGMVINLIDLPIQGYQSGGSLVRSPDGKQFAASFYVNSDNVTYVVNANGSDLHKVTAGKATSWSPDGTQLVIFQPTFLYTLNLGTSAARQILSTGNSLAISSDWSPDSNYIAYSNTGIGLMNRDGTNKRQLTTSENDICPAWQPTAH